MSCRVVWPSMAAWKQPLLVHVAPTVFVLLPVAVLLYKLPPRLQSPVAIVIGVVMGMVPPLAVALGLVDVEPQQQEQSVHPWMSLFIFSTFGFNCFFRCMTVALHTQPESVNYSLQKWLVWFASMPEPKMAKGNFVKKAKGERRRHALLLCVKFLAMATLLSVYVQHTTHPLQELILVIDEDAWHSSRVVGYALFLTDAWLLLWWIFLFVSFCLDASSFLVKLGTGYTTESSFQNPLLTARSYREFWGTKWNLPIHLFLKRTIYIPMRRQGCSASIAALAAFGGSGLLHEYNFYTHNHVAYRPMQATGFFLLVGAFMAAEGFVYNKVMTHYIRVESWVQRVPTFVIDIGLTLPLLPAFDSLFIKSWIEAGMLDSMREIIPHLECT